MQQTDGDSRSKLKGLNSFCGQHTTDDARKRSEVFSVSFGSLILLAAILPEIIKIGRRTVSRNITAQRATQVSFFETHCRPIVTRRTTVQRQILTFCLRQSLAYTHEFTTRWNLHLAKQVRSEKSQLTNEIWKVVVSILHPLQSTKTSTFPDIDIRKKWTLSRRHLGYEISQPTYRLPGYSEAGWRRLFARNRAAAAATTGTSSWNERAN